MSNPTGTVMEETIDSVCFHCGDQCDGTNSVFFQGRSFCCYGCRTVYELLLNSELDEYYQLEKTPGIKVDKEVSRTSFTYLDNETIQQQLLHFYDDQQALVTFRIPAIHCSSCILLLENLHRLEKGIQQSTVNFLKKEATLRYNPHEVSLRRIAELLYDIGYKPDIKLDSGSKLNPTKKQSGFALKLGVAGFCFGNIMLLSFPEYFSSTHLNEELPAIFNYLNLLLALPVVLYSGNSYFISAYKSLKSHSINLDFPIALGILALFIRSTYEVLTYSGPGYFDSLAGLIFFLLIGKWFQNKTYQALSFEKDYRAYFPIAVTRIVNDKEEMVPLDEIKAGDQLLIRNQEVIPCDGILKSNYGSIDYSFVTGESQPLSKYEGEKLFAGGRVSGKSITVRATKAISGSYLIDLWKHDAFTTTTSPTSPTLISIVSKYFTIAVLFIALAAGIYWWFIDPSTIWKVCSAVLIVACPCALALSIPFTFGNTIRVFGKHGLFMKDALGVEQLAKTTIMVLDKTGTLTEADKGEISYQGRPLSSQECGAIASIANNSIHPLSKALTGYLDGNKTAVAHFEEEEGKGLSGKVGNDFYQIGSRQWLLQDAPELGTTVGVEKNGRYIGEFKFNNIYRKGLHTMFKMVAKHCMVAFLSGDNAREKPFLEKLAPKALYYRFNQTPFDKLSFIRQLNQNGHHTVMVGDGLNDAGALRQSSFGIAVAQQLHHFAPASDAILQEDQLTRLPYFVAFSKVALNVVKISFLISFLYNVVGLSLAVQGLLSPIFAAILMPLSSITIVIFTTLSIGVLSRVYLRKYKI